MKCSSCGTKLQAEDRFCPRCGTAVTKSFNMLLWITLGVTVLTAAIVAAVLIFGNGATAEDGASVPTAAPTDATAITVTATTTTTTMTTTTATAATTTVATSASTVTRPTLSPDAQGRYDINIFLSNFSEQHFSEEKPFDAAHAEAEELVTFAYIFNYVNRYSTLHANRFVQENISYVYLTFEEINRDLERFFGLSVTAKEAQIAMPPTEYRFVTDDRVCWAEASGASHGNFTVIDVMTDLGNGEYQVDFTIYSFVGMGGGNHIEDESVYYMTPAEARATPGVEIYKSGRAIVRAASGASPYHLMEYRVY